MSPEISPQGILASPSLYAPSPTVLCIDLDLSPCDTKLTAPCPAWEPLSPRDKILLGWEERDAREAGREGRGKNLFLVPAQCLLPQEARLMALACISAGEVHTVWKVRAQGPGEHSTDGENEVRA